MSRVVISRAARDDRRAITEYTIEHFGIQQARRLRAHFETVLRTLTHSPLIGRTKAELNPPGRTFRYRSVLRSFIIVYEPSDEGIRVARRIHGARNLAAELARDPGERD